MTNAQPWWLTWPVAEVAAAILPLFSCPPFSRYEAEFGPVALASALFDFTETQFYAAEMGAMKHIVAWCRTGTPPGSFPLKTVGNRTVRNSSKIPIFVPSPKPYGFSNGWVYSCEPCERTRAAICRFFRVSMSD